MVRPITHPCGTDAAYYRHHRNGEVPDQACCDAHARTRRARYRAIQQLIARHRDEFDALVEAARNGELVTT